MSFVADGNFDVDPASDINPRRLRSQDDENTSLLYGFTRKADYVPPKIEKKRKA